MTSSIREQFCPNESCAFFEKSMAGNIVAHGKDPQRYRCKACKMTWVAHRQHVRFGLRTDYEKFQRAEYFLKSGMTIRKTAREINVSPSTIHRWKSKFSKSFIS